MNWLKRIFATIWDALTVFTREPIVPYTPISFRLPSAELVENITIGMKLKPEAATRHKEAVLHLCPGLVGWVKDTDEVNIDYKFCCEYFGSVEVALRHIQSICDDPDVVLDVSCESLAQGRILLYEVLKRLEQVIKTVEAR
jgi:hypothetical protein